MFDEWQQLKITNATPFAAIAARNRGMIATGNHYYLDSLRGAPPPKGAARGWYEFALVHSKWYSAYRKPLRHATRGPPQLCIKQMYAVEDGYTC